MISHLLLLRRNLCPLTRHLQAHKVTYRWGFPFCLSASRDGTQCSLQDLQESDAFLRNIGLPPLPEEDIAPLLVTPKPPAAPSRIWTSVRHKHYKSISTPQRHPSSRYPTWWIRPRFDPWFYLAPWRSFFYMWPVLPQWRLVFLPHAHGVYGLLLLSFPGYRLTQFSVFVFVFTVSVLDCLLTIHIPGRTTHSGGWWGTPASSPIFGDPMLLFSVQGFGPGSLVDTHPQGFFLVNFIFFVVFSCSPFFQVFFFNLSMLSHVNIIHVWFCCNVFQFPPDLTPPFPYSTHHGVPYPLCPMLYSICLLNGLS